MRRRGLRKQLTLAVLSVLALLFSFLSQISLTQATAAPALVTCVNLQTGTERISHTGKCRYTQEAQANWHKNPSDSPIASGASAKAITICSNKESSPVSYQVIRKKCARHQVTTIFSRSGTLPTKPVITEVVSFGHDSASLKLATDPAASQDAPIAFYTITSTTIDTRTPIIVQSQKVYYWKDLSIAINTLQASTRYTFTVSATNADGTSQLSLASLPVTTLAYVPPTSSSSGNSSVAVPAFTLSSIAETKTVNNAISGYTISSTGGTIETYSISPTAPTGTTFSVSTGLLTGTPTSSQSATAYTITATNVTGSASRTFSLTISPALSDDATLSTASRIKGKTPLVLGTPSAVLANATGGSVTISRTQALNTSNTGSFITTFTKTATAASLNRVVKYSVGSNFSGFQTDSAYNGTDSIADGDFFVVKVTAEDGTTVLYYKIDVTVSYAVGDTGPGGGIVFYYLAAGFNCGPNYTETGSPTLAKCKYLEVAPSSWGSTNDRTAMPWANVTTDIAGIPNEAGSSNNSFDLIGLGYKYSEYIVAQNGSPYNSSTNRYAAGNARAYTGGGLNDWYLPSSAEQNTLCQWNRGITQSFTTMCGSSGTVNSSTFGAEASGFTNTLLYWASSENNDLGKVMNWGVNQAGHSKTSGAYVRPIRAF